MEVPANAEYSFIGDWHPNPAQPVTGLIGSANPSLYPARHKPAKSDTEAFVSRRSAHDKAKPQSGCISALASRKGCLRACYSIPSVIYPTATQDSSYNIIHHRQRACFWLP
nr:hypothetical protein KK467_p1330 [Klebsiella pneumoniae]